MITLTYIFHSGFLVSAEGICSIVFDYWKEGPGSFDKKRFAEQRIPDFVETAQPDLPMYVMVSHHHKDHYNQSIFRWINKRRNIHYIISEDIWRFSKHLIEKLPAGSWTRLKNGETFSDYGITVKAYPSTDIGNSYVVTLGHELEEQLNTHILHAGDLNAWLWLDESTPEEIEEMRNKYSGILNQISAEYPHLDIAMFPVDSRLGRGYEEGAYQLIRKIKTDRFFPMHCGLGTEEERVQRMKDARRFELYARKDFGEYIALQSPGDSWAGNPVCR